MNKIKKKLIIGLVIVIAMIGLVPIFTTQADDIDKLIRIKTDDWWTYDKTIDEKSASYDMYNVTDTTVINLKELNEVDTNSTTLDYFITTWTEGIYGFDFSQGGFYLYNEARGNFIGLIEGNDTCYFTYNDDIMVIERTGILWERTSDESVNMALVTGEPQLITYESHNYRQWTEGIYSRHEQLDLTIDYLAYPDDPQVIMYEDKQTTIVNITISLNGVSFACGVDNSTCDIWAGEEFTYDYMEYPIYITYTYAQEIGLPIEIKVINSDVIKAHIPRKIMGTNIMAEATEKTMKLVNFDVDDADIDEITTTVSTAVTTDTTTSISSITTTTTKQNTPFELMWAIIALPVLIKKKRY